ncbi:5894_t:CDS:2, partial [Paraglomus occultum]
RAAKAANYDINPLRQENKRLLDELNEIKSKRMKLGEDCVEWIQLAKELSLDKAVINETFYLSKLDSKERISKQLQSTDNAKFEQLFEKKYIGIICDLAKILKDKTPFEVYLISFALFSLLLIKQIASDTVYLADGSYYYDAHVVEAFSIAALSPKSLTSTAERSTQKYDKRCGSIFYMPSWSFEELETLRSTIFSYIEPENLKEFFEYVGGVPRYTLQMPGLALLSDPDNLAMALDNCLRQVSQALAELDTPEKAVAYIRHASQAVLFRNSTIDR